MEEGYCGARTRMSQTSSVAAYGCAGSAAACQRVCFVVAAETRTDESQGIACQAGLLGAEVRTRDGDHHAQLVVEQLRHLEGAAR